MSILPPVPYRIPIADPRSMLIERSWQQFMEALRIRVGGGDATPIDEQEAQQIQGIFDTPWQPVFGGLAERLHRVEELVALDTEKDANGLLRRIALLEQQLAITTHGGVNGELAKRLAFLEEQFVLAADDHAAVMGLLEERVFESFTITGTGFTTLVTGLAFILVERREVVTLFLPNLTGTSNDTTFTLTGLPTTATPFQETLHPLTIQDNGAVALGTLRLNAGSTIIDLFPIISGGSWTASGTKRLFPTWLSYALVTP